VDLVVDERAEPGAVVGLEAGRCEHPVPAELAEVDGERVAAAARLRRRLVTVEVRRRGGSTPATVARTTPDLDLDVRLLRGADKLGRVSRVTGHICGAFAAAKG